jgi:hypothetical protein
MKRARFLAGTARLTDDVLEGHDAIYTWADRFWIVESKDFGYSNDAK